MANGPLLIVDDEPQNLAALREMLRDEFRLVFARSGEEALAIVRRHLPSLILLDVEMPGLDGYETCRRLKADPLTEHIPVLFVTGRTGPEDEIAGFEAGGEDYLAKPVNPVVARARIRAHLSLVRASRLDESYRSALAMLGAAGHYNDNDTGVHIWRMAAYARALAAQLGWSESSCALLELAAPMHDTGKIGIPSNILRKPGVLDAGEWAVMKTHSRIGWEILHRGLGSAFELAAEIALRHHEKWDGSGYPDGLSGEDIPESARIVAIADVFDALTMVRPYKHAWSLADAFAWIEHSRGSHFDAGMVDAFLDIRPEIEMIRQSWAEKEAEQADHQVNDSSSALSAQGDASRP
ncbi:response regulator [Niveibacterium terrae]|uniref:response regulator n=1 Tax=Niveibacterium terrae TaxID=3373598 RepID=UPI003A94AEF0